MSNYDVLSMAGIPYSETQKTSWKVKVSKELYYEIETIVTLKS